jgi:nucleoside-diphosphate-sugar epimerase
MRVFVAGATGALGKHLVPRLLAAGHEVTGMTRKQANADALREQGADAVVADALDADAVGSAIATAEPEIVVHQLTAIPASLDLRNIDREFAQTNRLRTEGTDILLSAALAAGARRFVAQSYAGWPYELDGPMVKDEDYPLQSDPPKGAVESVAAIRHVESAVTGAEGIEGIVLRYGGFYGPGTNMATNPDTEMTELVRKRKMPIVGGGEGVWSFIHIADAASATVDAIEGGAPGVYNVTDDEPAEVRDWLPYLAEALGAKKPMRIPAWLGRIVAGPTAVMMMTESRGASNAKAKRELGWTPSFASWRDGFSRGLA